MLLTKACNIWVFDLHTSNIIFLSSLTRLFGEFSGSNPIQTAVELHDEIQNSPRFWIDVSTDKGIELIELS